MNNKNGVTGFSFGLACFIMMVTFKLSLLIMIFVFKKFINIKHSYDIEDTINDNLFSNLRIKNMVITHLVFWTKRIALLMLIIFSPYYEAIYSVISGFIVFTSFTCLDLEYRATTNKLEVLYHVFIYSPPVIVSFINMLMEGHYISYDSKYITCCFTIGI